MYTYENFNGMNPLISEEAYFGINNPFVETIKAYVAEIRSQYEKTSSLPKKVFVENIVKIGKNLGAAIATNVNAESCSLTFIRENNAFCVPLCWDSYSELRSKGVNTDVHVASLEDIVEHKNGYRFKTPDRKHLIFGLGLGLFKNLDDDEITAIIFHEIGHSFQHMLVGINGNITWATMTSTINYNTTLLNIFTVLITFGASILSIDFTTVHKAKKDELDNFKYDLIDRNRYGKELEKSQKSDIRAVYDDAKADKNIIVKMFSFVWDKTIGIFIGVIKLITLTLYPLFKGLNVIAGLYELGNLKYLKKAKMFEQFADHFAASYGLGPHLASALSKISNDGVDIGSLSFLNYVPILNLWMAWSSHMSTTTSALRAGYPGVEGRQAALYKTLEYELENNDTLDDKDKKEIKEQMDAIDSVYKGYIERPGSKNFIFKLIHKITEKNVADVKSDIRENVLTVLNAKKQDIKKFGDQKDIREGMEKLEANPIAALKNIDKIVKEK